MVRNLSQIYILTSLLNRLKALLRWFGVEISSIKMSSVKMSRVKMSEVKRSGVKILEVKMSEVKISGRHGWGQGVGCRKKFSFKG